MKQVQIVPYKAGLGQPWPPQTLDIRPGNFLCFTVAEGMVRAHGDAGKDDKRTYRAAFPYFIMQGTAGVEPRVTLESQLSLRFAAGNPGNLIWIPNSSADIPSRAGFSVADVIDRHHFAIGTFSGLHACKL
jgi:hypothetical protein